MDKEIRMQLSNWGDDWRKEMYNESGLRIVKEDYYCEHWEPDDGALVPMKECWCCKWSNFRLDNRNGETENLSVCNYEGNRESAVNR